MAIHDIYSKRDKPLPDVYVYDKLNEKFKNQVYHIWDEFFDIRNFKVPDYDGAETTFWNQIYRVILKEEGKKYLLFKPNDHVHSRETLEQYFEVQEDIEKCLDLIELIFNHLRTVTEYYYRKYHNGELYYTLEEAIEDLNYRFRENGIGYQFENKSIIRVDNEILHKNVVKPVLGLLLDSKFSNANEEYLKAFEHYRNGRNGECLNECLKAFETTLKIICKENKWEYDKKATVQNLINVVLTNNLVPAYFESEFNGIKQLLESSVPTIRNKNSAHGQGTKKVKIPDHLASYMLYMTGATIKFLIESHQHR